MIDLKSIINTFSDEEKKAFEAYLDSRNKRNDTKNKALFKLLASDEVNPKTICAKLYKNQNKGAYHALRKRLFQSLIDFTANKNLEGENSVDMQIVKYILASRSFLLQNKYKVAYKILDKAESLAEEHLLYPILNEIYHTKIQYAYALTDLNIDELVVKQKVNRLNHKLEDDLNTIYAKLKIKLNTFNKNGELVNLENIIKQLLQDHSISLNESLTYKSLYQLLSVFNISAFVSNDYSSIKDFALESYTYLKQKTNPNKQVYYHIQCLYIIANTLFRNRDFLKSTEYIEEMKVIMTLNKKQYYKDFELKYVLIKSLNLHYLGKHESAIGLIENINDKMYKDLESLLDLKLCLLMFYFQIENINKAKSILSDFYHTDEWYKVKAGIDWVIKKNLIEILVLMELREENLLSSRLTSFKRKFNKYLKDSNQNYMLHFLKLAEHFYKNEKLTLQTISVYFNDSSLNKIDIFTLSFYAWLKSKTTNQSLLKTTFNLINTD